MGERERTFKVSAQWLHCRSRVSPSCPEGKNSIDFYGLCSNSPGLYLSFESFSNCFTQNSFCNYSLISCLLLLKEKMIHLIKEKL